MNRETAEGSRVPSLAAGRKILTDARGDFRQRASDLAQRRKNVAKIKDPIRRRAEQVAIEQEEYALRTSIPALENAIKRFNDEALLRDELTIRCA